MPSNTAASKNVIVRHVFTGAVVVALIARNVSKGFTLLFLITRVCDHILDFFDTLNIIRNIAPSAEKVTL